MGDLSGAADETLPASSFLWQHLLTTVINSDLYWEMGGSKPSGWSCLELAWFHTWYYSSKMPGLWLCRSNWDWTYPWATLTNSVYLVIGSPLVTMPPERNEITSNRDTTFQQIRNAAPLWALCEQQQQRQLQSTNGSTDFLIFYSPLKSYLDRKPSTWRNIHRRQKSEKTRYQSKSLFSANI